MKNYVALILWLIGCGTAQCQLSGTAFLQGQTNHSGIRVKFTSQGGTAVTDSAYTIANGNFAINITPGVYSIAFSKPGYVDAFYNNGSSVLLTNTTVLLGMSLIPGNAVFANGVISGTWSPSNVYIVNGNITIAANTTLKILAGTKVLFNGFYAIGGDGTIEASGNAGNPILFSTNLQSKGRGSWKEIGLKSTGSYFDHCIFEYASFALNFQQGAANVTNCTFRHLTTLGIYMGRGTPLISGNEIYDLDDVNSTIGIWVEGSATGTISCNYIHNGKAYGIIHNSSLVIDNRIDSIRGAGIETRKANARNINNSISNTYVGIDIDGSWTSTSPVIANNTLFSNKRAILIAGNSYPTLPVIVNNLITGNEYGIIQTGSAGGTFTVDHNNVWNNSVADYWNVQLVGLGQMIATNSAGHQIDAFFNMSKDPLYSNTPPLLSASSPCYLTGNTAYSPAIGFASPQNCAATVVSVKDNHPDAPVAVYPNPSQGMLVISSVSGAETPFTIHDLGGRLVFSGTAISGQSIDVNELENGIYIVTIKQGERTRSQLLAISK